MNPKTKPFLFFFTLGLSLILLLIVVFLVVLLVFALGNLPSGLSEEHLFALILTGTLVIGILSLAAIICEAVVRVENLRDEQKIIDYQANEEFRTYLLKKAKERSADKDKKKES